MKEKEKRKKEQKRKQKQKRNKKERKKMKMKIEKKISHMGRPILGFLQATPAVCVANERYIEFALTARLIHTAGSHVGPRTINTAHSGHTPFQYIIRREKKRKMIRERGTHEVERLHILHL